MKFTINKEKFLSALLNTTKVIASKSADPILSNVKMDLFEDRLELISSNGELTIKTIIHRFVDEKVIFRDCLPGSILLNGRMITEIIRKMDSEEVSISIEDNSVARITNNKSKFSLNVTRVEEYPDRDFSEDGIKVSLKSIDFINAINQTSFASSVKSRPILQCVNIENDINSLYFVATDGSRLSRKIIPFESDERFSVSIQAKNINEVVKTLTEEDEIIEFFVSERKVLFKMKNCEVISTITIGDYPNTHNIIPHNFNYFLEVNAEEFLKSLDRAVLLSIDRENIVKLTMTEDEVILNSRSQEIGDVTESLQLFKYRGDRLEISFNVNYVSQAIRALKSEEVAISFIGEMKPFTVTNKNDEYSVHLITPVRTY